ncbi:MAG: hypothetical protein JSV05_06270 [Candidatus Bathyarchaeota archaeon]|nr:MAG: hypothetical protein JSV05_06270 [Candidatus Bathyarchaeota archaeon]
MPYRVIIQTKDENGQQKEEWNKTEDTIDDCLDVLKDWIPNVIRRKNIINIQILREE